MLIKQANRATELVSVSDAYLGGKSTKSWWNNLWSWDKRLSTWNPACLMQPTGFLWKPYVLWVAPPYFIIQGKQPNRKLNHPHEPYLTTASKLDADKVSNDADWTGCMQALHRSTELSALTVLCPFFDVPSLILEWKKFLRKESTVLVREEFASGDP